MPAQLIDTDSCANHVVLIFLCVNKPKIHIHNHITASRAGAIVRLYLHGTNENKR